MSSPESSKINPKIAVDLAKLPPGGSNSLQIKIEQKEKLSAKLMLFASPTESQNATFGSSSSGSGQSWNSISTGRSSRRSFRRYRSESSPNDSDSDSDYGMSEPQKRRMQTESLNRPPGTGRLSRSKIPAKRLAQRRAQSKLTSMPRAWNLASKQPESKQNLPLLNVELPVEKINQLAPLENLVGLSPSSSSSSSRSSSNSDSDYEMEDLENRLGVLELDLDLVAEHRPKEYDNIQNREEIEPENYEEQNEAGLIISQLINQYNIAKENVPISNQERIEQECKLYDEIATWENHLERFKQQPEYRSNFVRLPDSLCQSLFRPLTIFKSVQLYNQLNYPPTVKRNLYRGRTGFAWNNQLFMALLYFIAPPIMPAEFFQQIGKSIRWLDLLQTNNPSGDCDYTATVNYLELLERLKIYDKYSVALCFQFPVQYRALKSLQISKYLWLRSDLFVRMIAQTIGQFETLQELKVNCSLSLFNRPNTFLANLRSVQLHILSDQEMGKFELFTQRYSGQIETLELMIYTIHADQMQEPWKVFQAIGNLTNLNKLQIQFHVTGQVTKEIILKWREGLSNCNSENLPKSIGAFSLQLYLPGGPSTSDQQQQRLSCNVFLDKFLPNLPNLKRFALQINQPLKDHDDSLARLALNTGQNQTNVEFIKLNLNSIHQISQCDFAQTVRTLVLECKADSRFLELCEKFPNLTTIHLRLNNINDANIDKNNEWQIDPKLSQIIQNHSNLQTLQVFGYKCSYSSLRLTIERLIEKAERSSVGKIICFRCHQLADPEGELRVVPLPNNLHIY